MKGYKAFEKGLVCRGKQYAENTVFEEESAKICESGMHFCANPLDCLDYYPLIDDNGNMTEFTEVEALDEALTDDNKKYCTKKIRVGAKLNLAGFIKASLDVTKEQIENEARNKTTKGECDLIKSGGSYSTLAGGSYSKLAGGDNSTLAGGSYSTLAGGSYSKLAGGDNSKLAGGYNSKLAGGYNSKLAGGSYSKLAGGDNSKLAGGSYSTLAGGDNSKLAGGKHSIMIGDNGSIAQGEKGALIVLVSREWQGDEYVITSYKAEIVDGERIKEDTPYKLANGEFVEVAK